jgi:hypothetical protein
MTTLRYERLELRFLSMHGSHKQQAISREVKGIAYVSQAKRVYS